jgi:hypothetical protein
MIEHDLDGITYISLRHWGLFLKEKPIKMYLCKIAYDYELGEDGDGTTLYPSPFALRREHKCTAECGVVEVTVSYSKTLSEPREEDRLIRQIKEDE